MNRPLSRPDKPYSVEQIIEFTEQHFLVDKSPRCISELGTCAYIGPGCFIGCLLTKEDAEFIEGDLLMLLDHPDFQEILSQYIFIESLAISILGYGQYAHDNLWRNHDYDRRETFKLLRLMAGMPPKEFSRESYC